MGTNLLLMLYFYFLGWKNKKYGFLKNVFLNKKRGPARNLNSIIPNSAKSIVSPFFRYNPDIIMIYIEQ